MKFLSIFLIVLMLFSIGGCNSVNNNEETDNNFVNLSTSQEEQGEKQNPPLTYIDKYGNDLDGFETESRAVFFDSVQYNPIDIAYIAEKNDGTTHSMVEIEVKYIEIWKKELEYSCEQLKAFLSEEKQSEFNEAQLKWEDAIQDDYEFWSSLYGEELWGRLYEFEIVDTLRAEYRLRTLAVKYLRFCIDNSPHNIVWLYEDE